ncbi:MAG: hypothetical protein ACI9TY_000053 [Alphaproteobacteria bacterium]|jgi:hypothetical protein
MSNIILFNGAHLTSNPTQIVTVCKVVKNGAHIKVPVYNKMNDRRFRNIFDDYNYIPVPVGSYILTDSDGLEFSITFEVLSLHYKPLNNTLMGADGMYQIIV